MGVLAIDFGMSRIKVAYWDKERSEAAVMLFNDSSGIIENLKLDLDKPYKHVPNGQRVKSL